MKNISMKTIMLLFIVGTSTSIHAGSLDVGTQFTYQGELLDNGSPANGEYDFLIQLYASSTGGSPIDFANRPDLAVSHGLFNVVLDYGDMPFNGNEMFLQINVRPGTSTDNFEPLNPRQRINATPYAIQAEFAENGSSPWLENSGGLTYASDVVIGNADTVSSSLFTVDTAANESPLRVKIAGATRMIVRDNGGTSIGANTSAPDNGLFVLGQVRQPLDQHGFAKAGIRFICGNSGTTIYEQFNNENSDAFTVDSGLPEAGRCTLSVPFDTTDSYLMVSTFATNFPRGVACGKTTDTNGDDVIECNAWNPLNSTRTDAVVTLLLF